MTAEQIKAEKIAKAIEFAKNFPVIKITDGLHPVLITIGNINPYNGKTIINLNCKTTKSGDRNASYSTQYEDYAKKFRPGQAVYVEMANGYPKKLHSAMSVVATSKAPSVSLDATVKASELAKASEAIVAQTTEVLATAPVAEPVAAGEDDKPF